MYAEWDSLQPNILDSPGYADFVGEALSALRVDFDPDRPRCPWDRTRYGADAGKVSDMKMPTLVAVNVLDAEYVGSDQIVEDLSNQFGKRFSLRLTGQSRSGF